VQVHDRTNIRELTLDVVGEPVDLVVGDLSFISLALVLDPLLSVTRQDGELALMVKPQFEVGKERVGKGGVVRDVALRAEAVTAIADLAAARGWGAVAVTVSPLPGPSGNVEFFLLLRHGAPEIGADDIRAEVERSASLGVAGERVDP
jgi:23S rRNA (cytidine1920-2'-O)/16S rRNA (cytidine1409-2'-O)-methyltransferase